MFLNEGPGCFGLAIASLLNSGFPKLILFPPLGQKYVNVVLKMSIDYRPSGPEHGSEVANGGRADVL